MIFPFICLAFSSSRAVTHGKASADQTVILLFNEQGTMGSGALLSPEVAVTVGHVASAESATRLRFTIASDGRRPDLLGEDQVGHFIKGKSFSRQIFLTAVAPPRAYDDSVTLLLVDPKDRKKFRSLPFPRLPRAGEKPSGAPLRAIGYGETGWNPNSQDPVRWMRNEGMVQPGIFLPRAPYLFETRRARSDQIIAAGDSGGALKEGNTLMGVHLLILSAPPDAPYLGPADRMYAGTDFWLGEPRLHAEIVAALKSWGIVLK